MAENSETLPSSFTQSIPDVVQRYRNGVPVTQLAADCRRSYQTIYNWMIRYTGEEYKHIKYEVAINRLADAEYERDTATTQLEYARARDKCKDYRDDLKRIAPDLYADKQFMQSDTKLEITIMDDRVTQPVVDVTPHNLSTPVSVQEVKESNE